jgi:hypothetical protein
MGSFGGSSFGEVSVTTFGSERTRKSTKRNLTSATVVVVHSRH